MEIPFLKMHGLGNDYVYLDCVRHPDLPGRLDLPRFAQAVSDRHLGIGGDGLILILPPDAAGADVGMRIFNADGSEGEMCGNGVRCLMRYAWGTGIAGREVCVSTRGGMVRGSVLADDRVCVDMGVPRIGADGAGFTSLGEMVDEEVLVGSEKCRLTAVSMGNPHVVSFWPKDRDLARLAREMGPLIERAPFAPERTNAEFVIVEDRNRLRMEVFERGSGITEACGTGACASLVAAAHLGLSDRSAQLHLRGGELDIAWQDDGHVMMTGTASFSFVGTCHWPDQEENAPW